MNRFIDGDFSKKALPPICDYQSEKLVSLEEALKFIVPLIEQLDRSIHAAKKLCHFPAEDNLTHDESAALYLYTMEGGENSFYRVLNRALLCEDQSSLKLWFPYLKLLHTALDKLPTVSRNIWRGVVGDIGHELKKNEELTWWNISSCSLSIDVIKDYLSTTDRSTLFLIEAVHGKDISHYTNYPGEDEILLGPGIQLRVVDNVTDLPGGLNIIHLAEVANYHDKLLQPSITPIHTLSISTDKDNHHKETRHCTALTIFAPLTSSISKRSSTESHRRRESTL
ncbi:unnamed protein product [Adineta steineri]|uniref:NAD(P)(+)--arginine ADP-ribosyltransferase n=1 Tax=Adineta steineri TaxID=433720 RepID=A0A813WIQ5_9BILA|nr:unnamed protein product [Adineta steineri]CAF0858015.1 unnamed protein product [Adineta steineri]CAF1142748.1 unnamed protein product [Adineta steineri]